MPGEAVLGNHSTWDSSRGEFVNSMHQRVAEIIADYDPGLRLLYIPSADRLPTDATPFAVGYVRWGLEPNIIMYLREDEVNETLLARLWMNDSRKNDPMEYLNKLETAHRVMAMKEELDRREEAMEMAQFMIKSPLHTINLGGGKKLHT